MPMINGIKMACICPHPPNNGCSCATVTAALPRSRKCGCGSKSASGAAGVNGASGNGSASISKTPRSPSKRAFFKPPMSPKSMARRIDPSALGRTDVNLMNIHAPPPGTAGWPSNGHPPQNIDNLSSLTGSGHTNGGQFMLPNESVAFFGGQGEQTAMFTNPGAGAYAQSGYPLQDPGPGEHGMYANGGRGDFNGFFDDGMGMSTTLGEGLDGFGLNLRDLRPGQVNGFHGLQYQASHTPAAVSAPAPAPAPVSVSAAPAAATAKGSCCAPATQPQHLVTESARHTPTSSTTSLASTGGSGTTASSHSNAKSCCSGSPVTASSSSSQQHTMLKSESRIGGGPGSVSLSSIPLAKSSRNGSSTGDVKPPMANASNGHVDQYASLQQQHGVPLTHYAGYAHQQPPQQQQQRQQQQQQQHQSHGSPAWYRYPPEYGTVSAPLQSSQWRASLITTGPDAHLYMQGQHQRYDAATIQHQQQQQHEQHHQQQQQQFAVHNGGLLDGGGDLHMCSCGDGCECIGCVAHPFNNATQDTIRSVWSYMGDSPSNSSARTMTSTSTATATATSTVTTTLPPQANADSTSPSQQAFTPSASDTSGVSEDQQSSLPAGDFLFVSYSVMDCDGEGLTCPCGDDCQCVGCTIHNNAL
ncbi:hypothetical protein SPBR_09198 [Sporothrix brasiliensis 5110]|uniref:Copper-activated transcription factor n=1 Tax=Sporothrix brasiliensis 5110 TaxID=1398154 RepID=A0A0C2IYF7_9PEZI|nr:uncharacterized protein SPBR_09198 [Sporothrix brasiliensis 5110]KIH94106.1 hypothetical protein SPBR_09198 [Sporothrix brasiliensis 5110]